MVPDFFRKVVHKGDLDKISISYVMMTILHIGRQKMSDSITKFGCNTNIKSMQDDDVLFVPGGSLTI